MRSPKSIIGGPGGVTVLGIVDSDLKVYREEVGSAQAILHWVAMGQAHHHFVVGVGVVTAAQVQFGWLGFTTVGLTDDALESTQGLDRIESLR